MNRLDRYLFKTVASTALVALLVLLALDLLINLLLELEDLGEGDYDLKVVLQYLSLTLPRRIYETFPMALLVGGLLGMGELASSSELIAMRVSGLSLLRLVASALRAGLALSLLVLLLGEFIAPETERIAQELRARARSQDESIRLSRSFWARDGNSFVHIGAILPGLKLADIAIYELDGQSHLKAVTRAQAASYLDGHWVLQGVTRNAIKPEAVTTDTSASIAWDSVLKPSTLEVLVTDPEDLSMSDLLTYIDYLKDNHQDTSNYELAFWIKALVPLTNLAILFVAMPFVFGSQRTAGAGQRLLVGILLGLGFFLINRMLSNLVLLYGYPPVLGPVLPALLLFVTGGYALLRIR